MRDRKERYEELNKRILQWIGIRAETSLVTSVGTSWFSVREKAEQPRSSLLLAGKSEYQSFRASPGWFENLRSKYGISLKILHGEAGSVDQATAEAQMVQFRDKLHKYSSELIFNADHWAHPSWLTTSMLSAMDCLKPG